MGRPWLGAPFAPVADGETINILIFGGSQGAKLFSGAPVEAIAKLPPAMRQRLRVTHQVRDEDLEAVRAAYANAGVAHEAAPFFKDLPRRIAGAHLVIARAGASTVTEIAAIGRPSILVPLAIAMDDHQTGNARVLSEAKAALLAPEKDFNVDFLDTALATLLANPARLAAMAAATKTRVRTDAAERLADLVENMVAARKAA